MLPSWLLYRKSTCRIMFLDFSVCASVGVGAGACASELERVRDRDRERQRHGGGGGEGGERETDRQTDRETVILHTAYVDMTIVCTERLSIFLWTNVDILPLFAAYDTAKRHGQRLLMVSTCLLLVAYCVDPLHFSYPQNAQYLVFILFLWGQDHTGFNRIFFVACLDLN